MYIELSDLFWLSTIALALLYWWHSIKIKELALREVRRQCKAMDLQLLDQSVALKGLKLKRNAQGRLGLLRRYDFNFSSTGDDRYQGSIQLQGKKVIHIELAPHRI